MFSEKKIKILNMRGVFYSPLFFIGGWEAGNGRREMRERKWINEKYSIVFKYTYIKGEPSPTPEDPVNPYPSNGQSNVSVYVTLLWSECTGADYYNIYIWLANQEKPVTPSASGLTSPQYTP